MKSLQNKGFGAILALALFTLPGTAMAQDHRGPNSNPSRMQQIELHPSQALLDYQTIMMPVQRALMGAYYAGICQFRSETYFQTFQTASMQISRIEAAKLHLSNDEIVYADRTAKEIMRREDAEAGFDNLQKRCRQLRPHLTRLDAVEQTLTDNYH